MKKLLLILAVSGVLAACNDSATTDDADNDSVMTIPSTVDSITVDSTAVSPMVDTLPK